MDLLNLFFLLQAVVFVRSDFRNFLLQSEHEDLDNIRRARKLEEGHQLLNDYVDFKLADNTNWTSDSFDSAAYCKSFRSCERCVNSRLYGCGWCHDVGCTHIPRAYCPQTYKRYVPAMGDRCPKIYNYDEHEPIIAHVGKVNLKFKIHVTDRVINKKNLLCEVIYKNKMLHLKAVIMGDEVICEQFIENQVQYNLQVRVNWGGAYKYSNELPLVLYRCAYLGKTCDLCQKIPDQYGCGWCSNQEKCTHIKHCMLEHWIPKPYLHCRPMRAIRVHEANSD